ncbi:hypothetical protein J7443_24775 [Tropicibacter sp. R15_0]|uniref:aldolase/citrate lyase family protein n=1 Tax=Tropicibacter sp. R15_0 TaxID=2821101 RepID=UPI001ADC35B6|nr:hypothetical protein [Tropicibacter sp. R15_0]
MTFRNGGIEETGLGAGVQSILVPIVESGAQAKDLVAAVTYPPQGVRGVGSALARASEFSAIPDYLTTADEQICLLVQVENRAGMAALDDILATDVDGVFIGPSDLAADMGHIGQAGHPEVKAAVLDAIKRIVAASKGGGKTGQSGARRIGSRHQRCKRSGNTTILSVSFVVGQAWQPNPVL